MACAKYVPMIFDIVTELIIKYVLSYLAKTNDYPYFVKIAIFHHKGIVAIIVILAILAGAGFLYSNAAKVKAYNQFAELYNTMAEGARKAETANILIIDVWKNSIWKTADDMKMRALLMTSLKYTLYRLKRKR